MKNTYRVTDNIFYNAFETSSSYDAIQHAEERCKESNLVVTLTCISSGTSSKYRWSFDNNSIEVSAR